ncbi:energy-coupling factor transporter ATPase [Alkalicoccus urumqiensis]|uniref:Energy-coupling factor transporter ATPase n=2 Tax=Alkalicoccus urumqiensis TaxID=1548213 RepID=A0A2P6ME68_ALKUR|nr:energy-coupling factor transporter ATPase [Alkalicoccus urumqiensis]
MAVIEAEGVTFSYNSGETPALHDITMSVEKGEWVAVTGHNGSGKSTLARLFNSLLVPQQGTIRTCGRNTADPAEQVRIRRRAGMVFQHPDNQIVAPTVADDVAFGLENAGVPAPEMKQRVEHAIGRLGLTGLEDQEPHRLSGGQKQRVALAGVLALRPEVILLDEATSMLDPSAREDVRRLMKTLCREEGIALVSVTHDMTEAAETDRMIVLDQGRITAEGSPRSLFQDPARLEEAGLRLPVPLQLSLALQARGIQVPEAVSEEELVNALCR